MAGSASDTWGISGPDFLTGYGLTVGGVSLLALALALWWRRDRTDPRRHRELADALTPVQAGYLNGGPRSAVLAALAGLRAMRLVVLTRRGQLGTTRKSAGTLSHLEQAVHRAVRRQAGYPHLHREPGVREALRGIDARLVRAGLLVPAGQRAVLRYTWYGLLGVAGIATARLVASLDRAVPVGWLLLFLSLHGLVLVGLAAGYRRRFPRTRTGEKVLAHLTRRHAGLAPARRPAWNMYGSRRAAMSAALFGTAAWYAGDPGFAAGLGLPAGGAVADTVSSPTGAVGSSGGCGAGGGCGG